MNDFTEKLNPIFRIDTYDQSDKRLLDLLKHIHPILSLIESSDYIKVWREYGYFELVTLPNETFKRNLVISIIPPEDVYARYQDEFAGTICNEYVPLLQSFGIDLFVWAEIEGHAGIYLTTNQPPRRPSMFHFVASSIENLLFTDEGIENLSKDFDHIYFYRIDENISG